MLSGTKINTVLGLVAAAAVETKKSTLVTCRRAGITRRIEEKDS